MQQQIDLLGELNNLGENIPGLDKNTVLNEMAKHNKQIKDCENMLEEERIENIERGMGPEEADKIKKTQSQKILDEYIKNMDSFVTDKINKMKTEFKIFKDGVTSIPSDISLIIANIIMPATITAPPGAPNPVYSLNIAMQSKNTINSILNIIINSFITIIGLANDIMFTLPSPILTLGSGLKNLSALINTIPV